MTLSQENLKTALTYDPQSGVFTWIVSTGRVQPGKTAGTISNTKGCKRIKIKIEGELYYASRLAFLYMTGAYPKHLAAHKDGDTLNNRWMNLQDSKVRGKKYSDV